MIKHATDLRLPAFAADLAHHRAHLLRIRNVTGCATFGETTEIDELDRQAANRRGGAKHIGLQCAGEIPGRLAAHGGIKRDHQFTARTCGDGGHRIDGVEKGGDGGRPGSGNGLRPLMRFDIFGHDEPAQREY